MSPVVQALSIAQSAVRSAGRSVLAGRKGVTPPIVSNGAASPATVASNAAIAAAYDLTGPTPYADATRGYVAAPSGRVVDADGAVVWDFESFDFLDGTCPETVNPSLWRQAGLNNNVGLFEVTEGIWQLRGFDLANITLVQGRTGLIVIDTLTARETAAAAMAFARQHLGDQPVSAVVFTHSHLDHFGGALGVVSAEEVAARDIPVVAPSGFMDEAMSENLMAGVAMTRRARYMYGIDLPRSATGLVDNGLGKATAVGRIGILVPTVLVESTPQEMELDGVRFLFHNVPGSEAPAELTFTLPDHRAYCGAEMLSQTMHNLYTLRGAKVRDARVWAGYIDEALVHAADAEVFLAQHHWPIWGNAQITEFITKQRDVYRYIHDQTVRLMNSGLTAPDIAETLTLPSSLDAFLSVHGYYGTVRHNARAVYQHYLGWFDAHPANLDPHPPAEAARRYVDLAGGVEDAIATAQAAYDRADYRWAAELLKHVVFAEPRNDGGRELLARTLEQLGFVAESAIWRNFYLTGAHELRNGPPASSITRASMIDMLEHTPIGNFLDAMTATLDGPRADGTDLSLNLEFSDLGENHHLWIENAVLHHRPGGSDDADATLVLTKPFFLRMATGQAGAADLLLSTDVRVRGNKLALGRFFSLLDNHPGTFPIVAPNR
jgi:alkyl sulfatase BDS1-like metallo-beta-lactamase superfamily hydrolase